MGNIRKRKSSALTKDHNKVGMTIFIIYLSIGIPFAIMFILFYCHAYKIM